MTPSGFTHEAPVKGATNVWLTPFWILRALGDFDLDPCAAPSPRPWATAQRHYDITQGEDGLRLPWDGRVWCNPPYGPDADAWLYRLANHGRGIALTFARTETRSWHRSVWPRCSGILFLAGRLRFCRPNGIEGESAAAPSALIAYGLDDAETLRLCQIPGCFVRPEKRHQVTA